MVALLALRAKNLKSSIRTLLGDTEEDKDTSVTGVSQFYTLAFLRGAESLRSLSFFRMILLYKWYAPPVTNKFYENPLIKSFNQQGNKWLKQFLKGWNSVGPSYLNAEAFSDILLEVLRKDYGLNFETGNNSLDNVIKELEDSLNKDTQSKNKNLSKLPKELRENLSALARKTKYKAKNGEATIKEFRANIAVWYNESMDRATGVYKRNTFGLSFILGLVIAVAWNIDTVHIVNQLYNDPALNKTLSGFVEQRISSVQTECENSEKSQCIEKFKEIDVNQIRSFPIGWESKANLTESQISNSFTVPITNDILYLKRTQSRKLAIAGWVLTAFALAQGAPFWFDLLNKVVEVRSSGQRYDSKNDPKKENKQQN
ncbi:hypothetical protein [Crocosphaera sp. Alani8]|uniref:hypothetical protein n=1 Tax=Crocosphaera sp. Alani8 TaxID=3038952 RepID=UPI00313D4031